MIIFAASFKGKLFKGSTSKYTSFQEILDVEKSKIDSLPRDIEFIKKEME